MTKDRPIFRAWQISFAEVRRIMVDVDDHLRRPLIEDLYGDVVGEPIAPEPPPRHHGRLWDEFNRVPPEAADLLVADFAPRYVACVIAAARAGKPVPRVILDQVRQRPEYEVVREVLDRGGDVSEVAGEPPDRTAKLLPEIVGVLQKAAVGFDRDLAADARRLLIQMGIDPLPSNRFAADDLGRRPRR